MRSFGKEGSISFIVLLTSSRTEGRSSRAAVDGEDGGGLPLSRPFWL